MGILDFFSKLTKPKESLTGTLAETRHFLWERLSKIIVGKSTVDGSVLDRLEELLISSDVGVPTTLKIIAAIEKRVAEDKYLNTNELNQILRSEVGKLLLAASERVSPIAGDIPTIGPKVILIVGVNGVGKTTTIGKLAAQFVAEGQKVILAAADTFRAAAVEQLTIWGNRIGATVVARGMQADPSSVAYEAVNQGKCSNTDVVIVDTAGRLHTKTHLIQELTKIKRTIQKCLPSAPHEVLLILDGTTGQNAFLQAEAFTAAVQVTGIIVTKLDGTPKGGVILGIVDQFAIPIRYIGTGEQAEDLKPFNPQAFVEALFEQWQPIQ